MSIFTQMVPCTWTWWGGGGGWEQVRCRQRREERCLWWVARAWSVTCGVRRAGGGVLNVSIIAQMVPCARTGWCAAGSVGREVVSGGSRVRGASRVKCVVQGEEC